MTLKKIFPWTPVLLWMTLIFYLSHQPAAASNELSTGLTQLALKIIEKVTSFVHIDLASLNHMVRKSAHFLSYLILGFLLANALRRNEVVGWKNFCLALLISVLFAMSDEFHQLFVPGRGGQVKDVLIDSGGAVFGIGMYLLFFKRGEYKTKMRC